jgi:hypothetical protein
MEDNKKKTKTEHENELDKRPMHMFTIRNVKPSPRYARVVTKKTYTPPHVKK